LDRAAISGMDAEFVDDYMTIRAHIEGLEAEKAAQFIRAREWAERCGQQEARAEAAEARGRKLEAWRDAVMDGLAVYDRLPENARTGPEDVSDVLDAVAKVARATIDAARRE